MFIRGRREWESVVCRLDKFPFGDIIKVLRLSYDRLDDGEKSVFLDVACFFKG